MKHYRLIFFFLAGALALSGCGIFGGSDGTDLSAVEDLDPQPTVNNVQAVPADDDTSTADSETPAETTEAGAALPTAITLPTAAPSAEPTADRSQPTTYVVQSGDVLGLIAERFDVDIAELRLVNALDGNLIRVGQELTIPAIDGATGSADASTAATAAPAATSAPAATVSCNSAAAGHCIQPGESLLGIALKYDVTVETLRAANPGVTGDLIRSGEILNLPGSSAGGGSATPAPAPTTAPAGTPAPVATTGPANDADCAALNPGFPYFHAADGLCYANPIGGGTAVPTVPGSDPDQTCREGFFLWDDGLCYPIPGVTVTPTAGPTPTSNIIIEDYGRPPCDAWEVVLVETNKCWPLDTATDAQKEEGRVKTVTPTVTPTP